MYFDQQNKIVEGNAYNPILITQNEEGIETERKFMQNDGLRSVPKIGSVPKNEDDSIITYKKQSGANCGFYAAAMACCSLWGITDPEFIDIIAKDMEKLELGQLSAFGDMYSAGALSIAISTYVDSSSELTKLDARVFSFCNKDDIPRLDLFKHALVKCMRRGLRVLIPYYSVNSEPGVPSKDKVNAEGQANAQAMDKAHWCVVSDIDEKLDMLCFDEGNNKEEHATSVKKMFESNKSLGNRMDWNSWINDQKNERLVLYILYYHDKRKGHILPGEEFLEYIKRKKKSPLFDPSKELLEYIKRKKENPLFDNALAIFDGSEEIVDLRGKMIVIGKMASTGVD